MKLIILTLITISCFLFYNCSEDSTGDPQQKTGKFIITSTPAGAQIFLNGNNTGKITPYTFEKLEVGNYNGYLFLSYYDTVFFSITIQENLRVTEDFTLVDNTPFIEFTWDYLFVSGDDSVRFNFQVNQDILLDSIIVYRPINTVVYTTDRYFYTKKLLVWKNTNGDVLTYYLPPEESANRNYRRIVNRNYRIDVYGQKANGNQDYFHSFYSQILP
jgi:hypothetical protein